MRRLVCWLKGHDWYNSADEKTTFMVVRLYTEDRQRGGNLDLCFRCGKLRWQQETREKTLEYAASHPGLFKS